MPFCMAVLIITISLSEIVTLQVRIPNKYVASLFNSCQRRKAFLSASIKGSMTLEAAFVLSLLVFASVSLILPMKILNTERKVQAGLESVGEELSRYAYLRQEFWGAEGFAQAQVMEHVDTGVIRQVTMRRSRFMEDGEHLDLILDYTIQMPFPVLGLRAVSCTARCRRRAWIGKEGNAGTGDENHTESEDEMVYIGKDSTRYHIDRNCHYLANQLTAVSYETAIDSRNGSGGRYHACSVCGKQAGPGSTVYILKEGSSYHTTKICTAILAYVRTVKLSEVKHLGPCSYCSQ